ncbi:small cysteine-rich protein [Agaricus bisporus var. bisporus H97]|uniref:small cysteine-rich protein n=1 Tax=Agaricus bisporus var. bisporus (strain H97 / ATCC MYA-4626 / FGSC 10389) TaxID=936046 RepID=UPI00029F7BCE|nr:small cysteine-rich protein [Agaricus bisporus var. bisporus H97]EKV47854.1 small cysteine-rich protein [Agaricus bisporus var. bisporus H97]
MKLVITSFILAAVGVMAIPAPQGTVCAAVCREEKPVCPAGQQASGSEGCWGCCQPIPYTEMMKDRSPETSEFCTAVCRTVKPVCPEGEAATGSPGCWGCCQPVSPSPKPTPRPCLAVCLPEKPICPVGEAATGNEECWGCCQPIGSF